MEAMGNSRCAPREVRYAILGVEGDETWGNHRDPERSLRPIKETVQNAHDDGHDMLYKVWVKLP